MLAEYSFIKDLRSGIVCQVDDSIKFYFSLVSASGAIAAFFSQIFGVNTVFFVSISILLFFLLILGEITFNRIVEGHISIITYTRGLNRIRKFFVDIGDVQNYILLPINDDVPHFGEVGFSGKSVKLIGISTALITINSLFFSILIFVLMNLVFTINIMLNFIFPAIVFIGIMSIHFRFLHKKIIFAEMKYPTKFPSKKTSTDDLR